MKLFGKRGYANVRYMMYIRDVQGTLLGCGDSSIMYIL